MLLTGGAPFCYERQNKLHRVPQSDQRGVKAALGSSELTPRETEVLFWISRGKSNHDIGVILGAKTGTICKHVGHILSKLNVENRTSAALVALETRRTVEVRSESKPGALWATTQLLNCVAIRGTLVRRLRNFRRAPVFRRVMRRSFVPRLKFEKTAAMTSE